MAKWTAVALRVAATFGRAINGTILAQHQRARGEVSVKGISNGRKMGTGPGSDANGNFTAEGTYTPQRGGPVKKDAPPQDLPATYKGTIHGDTMHLEVILADKQQQLPSLTLTRNQAGRIVKCR